MDILAIIPCYNVAKHCQFIIEETLRFVNFLVLVDDGSTDETGAILQQIRQKNLDKIHLISFPKNRGKGIALLEAMKYALSTHFDILITIDSDGQHLPTEIPQFISCIVQGAEFVIGHRALHKMPFRSRISNATISFLLRLVYPHAPIETQSGFRAFSRKFIQKFVKEAKGDRYEMEFQCILIALRDGDKIVEYPIATIYLEDGTSHFRKIKDSFRILKVLFEYRKYI